MASPLSQYFLSAEYLQGQDFPFQDNGYSPVESTDQELQDVYEHEVSKIRVWSFALDARSVREGGRVVYHYTSEVFFKLITHPSKENIGLFASKNRNADSNHGLGLYGTSKAPDQWTCQDEALINNFWPRPHTWDKWREKQGLQPAPRPEGSSARELLETELLDYVRTAEDPQLQQPGFNRFGEKEPPWRDVHVIALWCRDGQVTNLVQASDATIHLMRQRVEVRRKALGAKHRKTLRSMSNLSSVLWARGQGEEAEQMCRLVLKVETETLGACHPDTLASMSNLGSALRHRGKLEEAERWDRVVLKVKKKTLGAQHPSTLVSMNNLAVVLQARGKLEEAEQLHREALNTHKESLGASHPRTLGSMHNLARVVQSRGSLEEAEQLHRDVLKTQKETLGAQHLQTLHSMSSLAVVLQSRGCLEEAEQCLAEVSKARKESLGSQHPKTLSSMHKLAILLQELGRFSEAEELFREASDGRRAVLGASPVTLSSIKRLAVVLRAQGKTAEANQLDLGAPAMPGGVDCVISPIPEESTEDH